MRNAYAKPTVVSGEKWLHLHPNVHHIVEEQEQEKYMARWPMALLLEESLFTVNQWFTKLQQKSREAPKPSRRLLSSTFFVRFIAPRNKLLLREIVIFLFFRFGKGYSKQRGFLYERVPKYPLIRFKIKTYWCKFNI